MNYDPLSEVIDEPLDVNEVVVGKLDAFRIKDKFSLLPGVDTTLERERLSKVIDGLTDALIAGIEANPTKLWVMGQFQVYLVQVEEEDTEGREHFGMELEELMDILGIESSDGLLSAYLGGF
jgi:hypothetical protein